MASLLAWLPALAVAAANDCDVAVVGGGWAGLYTAYRLAPTTPNLCLFEARHKTGGRTYSVREDQRPAAVTIFESFDRGNDESSLPTRFVGEDDLTIDIGAYRFGRDMHLPGDLIRFDLNLSTRCYQPDCGLDPEFNTTLYKIVDGDAAENAAGYETPLRLMTRDLVARGVRVEYGRELVAVEDGADDRGARLVFADGSAVEAGAVLLNLPRKAITALDAGDSPLFRYDATAARLLATCEPCPHPEGFEVEQLKVYLVYPEPWWRTELGILEGSFAATNSSPPFFGRFHDGPMLRDAAGALVGAGAIETVYTFNEKVPSITYYDAYRAAGDDPLTVSTNATLLAESHAKLLALHAADFASKGVDPATVAPPTSAVMGFWDASNKFLPTPMSSNFKAMLKTCPEETCLGGVDGHAYTMKTSNPTGGKKNLFVANNDYWFTGYQGTPCCWAEQSLKVAEHILKTHFALPKPAWLDEAYYRDQVSAL